MSGMRGADLVVEYLIREKVPYLFGYGDTAPSVSQSSSTARTRSRWSSRASRPARATWRTRTTGSARGDPRIHVHRPRPDAAHGAMANAFYMLRR